MTIDIASWIKERGIGEVECIVPDMNGIQRGKVLPAAKFVKSLADRTLHLQGTVVAVPEPGTAVLWVAGLVLLVRRARRALPLAA